MENNNVIVERVFNAPLPLVWKAITEKDLMKQWYFELSDFKPKIDFEFQFYGQGLKGETYLHKCKILEIEPLKKLKHSWTYEGFEGYSTVTFELSEESINKTKVKLTHEGLATFPVNNPDFVKENFVNGWTYIINTALKDFLESKQ
ncbi:SRPBCC domain-containing protein [Mariniflexile gromovii]|uniref:SRPBCC domain-containing protein n=1 Tax=Mariniflexile gromovii TaxID=362523 RepID=A0ABS4BUH9_9FLAO|nr:SRPBCC domain-containing protein [Mariniflexile gromovii]MBP0904248.1 SRPBCC domain-containing protein [Mariniflexile gromovii]